MALRTRHDLFGLVCGVDARRIYPISRLVSHLTGIPVQPNKAIVGANAFAHSSGIHQDGVLKERTTYEIIDPRDIGVPDSEIILSARSGRAGLRHRLAELGYTLDGEQFEKVYQRFLSVADKKKTVDTRDLEAIVDDEVHMFFEETYHLEQVQVACVFANEERLQPVDEDRIERTETAVTDRNTFGPIRRTHPAEEIALVPKQFQGLDDDRSRKQLLLENRLFEDLIERGVPGVQGSCGARVPGLRAAG